MWSRNAYWALIAVILVSALGGSCLTCAPSSCGHRQATAPADVIAELPAEAPPVEASPAETPSASSHCAQAEPAAAPTSAHASKAPTAQEATEEQKESDCCGDAGRTVTSSCIGSRGLETTVGLASLAGFDAPILAVESFGSTFEFPTTARSHFRAKARPPNPPRSLHSLHSVFLI